MNVLRSDYRGALEHVDGDVFGWEIEQLPWK